MARDKKKLTRCAKCGEELNGIVYSTRGRVYCMKCAKSVHESNYK